MAEYIDSYKHMIRAQDRLAVTRPDVVRLATAAVVAISLAPAARNVAKRAAQNER
jgi:hypothetical protein